MILAVDARLGGCIASLETGLTFKAFMSCLSQPPFFLTAGKAIQKDKFPLHGMKLSVILLFAFVPHQEEMTNFSLSGSSGEI